MSFTTVFDSLPVVTSTTTANLMTASDPILIHSTTLKNKGQSTIGSVSSLWSVSTSSSTATNIPPFGLYNLQSPSTSSFVNWLLSTATQNGQCVTLFYQSTSSSTQTQVTTASTANMTFASTDAQVGMTITFSGVPRAYVELMASAASSAVTGVAGTGSAQWLITGRSAAGVVCT